MTRFEHQNITKKEYDKIHMWLWLNFPKASECAHCGDKNKTLHNALIAGKKYEMVKENFISLCPQCHRKYDAKHALPRTSRPEAPIARMFTQTVELAENNTMEMVKKVIPLSVFQQKISAKNKRAAAHVVSMNRSIKVKIPGIREVHVNYDKWEALISKR